MELTLFHMKWLYLTFHKALGDANGVLYHLMQIMAMGRHPDELQQGNTRAGHVQSLAAVQPKAKWQGALSIVRKNGTTVGL
jgi:hypothetical protein